MNSFQELLSHYLLSEAISLKNAKKKFLSKKYSGAYQESLNKIFENKNRILLPLTIDYTNIDSPLMKKIDSFLYDDYNYRIPDMENYIKGFAYKFIGKTENYSYGSNIIKDLDMKNPVKIGKLLQKYEKDGEIEVTHRKNGKKTTKKITGKPLLHEFKNDPIRSSNGEFAIVISRHPYDIAGASTDRSWTSCIDLGLPRINYPNTKQNEGINKKYIPRDIEEGTLVAYVVTRDELFESPNGDFKVKLHKPLSRILMKPHNSDIGKVYSVGKMYGNQYPEFYQKVKEWISKNINNKLTGKEKVYKNPKLYNDGDNPVDFEFNTGNEIADEVVNELLTFSNDDKYLGNQITFETSNNGTYVNVELKITVDFGKEIVRPFDYLDNIYSVSNNINSDIEKMIARAIFDQLKGSNYISPKVSATSLGDGIEIDIDFGVQTHGEDDKYIDNEYIYDNLIYSFDWLKNFDYLELKRDLYKICSTYDWEQHEKDKTNKIIEALQNYKDGLLDSFNYLSVSKEPISNLKPIYASKALEMGDKWMVDYFNNLRRINGGLQSIMGKIQQYEQTLPFTIKNNEYYIKNKHDITFEKFKEKLGVDLEYYKNRTEELWSAKILIDMLSGNPIPDETWENLKDIDDEQDKIIRQIRFLIGYRGEIKI